MAKWSEYGTVMTINRILLCICWLIVIFASCSSQQMPSTMSRDPQAGPLVLLVSFDGFRWDYLDRTATPNFDSLINDGVKAKYLYDVFASKTFPNHYTIATGLYEESHGLVGNFMFDPEWNETFNMGKDKNPKWWNEGEPIWVTNQLQGGESGVIMWPGMDIKIHNHYPTYRLPEYNQSFPFHERVDIMTELFANGSINLGLLYFHEPDHSGHTFGPDSPKLDAIIQMCDETVGYLMETLQRAGLKDRVSVIITSDHGMTEVSSLNFTQLDDFVDPSLYHYTNNNPVIGIWPYKENDTDVIYNKLSDASPHMKAYLKDEIPKQYHYMNHRRISPILLVAEEGWSICRGNYSNGSCTTYRGNHGYNNSLMTMHPIFVAHGPSFKQDVQVEPFSNVNIYTLICHLLGIQPAPNNGSFEQVQDLLRTTYSTTSRLVTNHFEPIIHSTEQPPVEMSTTTIIGLSLAGGVAFLAGCLLIAMCMKQRTYRQQPRDYAPIADTSLDNVDEPMFQSYNYPNTKI